MLTTHGLRLPPGQRAVAGFPRFGKHLHHPPPEVPADHAIEVHGAVRAPFSVPVGDLLRLPRRERTADFHCVAGWSAVDLRWAGVAFDDFYREVVVPVLDPTVEVTHVVFGGIDGYRSAATIEDARHEDVLIADHLDGAPLDPDHGAPVRLVSPSQYGFVSTKHLSRIELRTAPPSPARGVDRLLAEHPRARVWAEERHADLPGRWVRPVYRLLVAPLRALCAWGSSGSREAVEQ